MRSRTHPSPIGARATSAFVRHLLSVVTGIALATPLGIAPRAAAAQFTDIRADVAGSGRIKHVVIIFQENHSFDNLLGVFCVNHPERHCNGATHGRVSTGARIRLRHGPDIPPHVLHRPIDQIRAIDGGKMDGYNLIEGCGKASHYRCYSQYYHADIPALWHLARDYVISSRTFEQQPVTSWGSHLQLGSATLDGFNGYNPGQVPKDRYGWGCDSHGLAGWTSPEGDVSLQPSCIPKPDGSGPFTESQVPWVPTIMDRLRTAGLSWRIYAADGPFTKGYGRGYAWAICPSFADCIYNSGQRRRLVEYDKILRAGKRGNLPSFSIVIPLTSLSQHNGDSMILGDNWIAKVVNAIGTGPDWKSTAIFITYDDCGCFYDHVPPPPGRGIRVPMVIVSPYAKRFHTDTNTANYASMLAYTEHLFRLKPLTEDDATSYDYRYSFNYNRPPRRFEPLPTHRVPQSSLRYMASHPQRHVD
jgi:phospholipase C